MNEHSDFGPLPQVDENAILQDESFEELKRALPRKLFVLRQEGPPDTGVDKSIELRLNGLSTGMRTLVQVKATATTNLNADGSVSFSAETKNLNYLLNGGGGLYVLYLKDRKDLRFAWVREEVNRIEQASPRWLQQKHVTLRFSKSICSDTWGEIFSQIQSDSQTHRRIQESLSRTRGTKKTIHVDLENSTVLDPDQIREFLLQGGLTLVSSGRSAYAVEMIQKLSTEDQKLPKILLIRGYAEILQARYQMAGAHIADSMERAQELSPSDRQFVTLLRDTCDHQLGHISHEEYMRRQLEASESATDEFGLSRRIDYLWNAMMSQGTKVAISTYLPQLREAVAKIEALLDVDESLVVQARTAKLYGDGIELSDWLARATHSLRLRRGIGNHSGAAQVMADISEREGKWIDDSNRLAQDALRIGDRRLIGDVCYVRSYMIWVFYSSIEHVLPPDYSEFHLRRINTQIIPDVRRAIDCYHNIPNIEWKIRAKLLLADFLHITGDEKGAKQEATEVLPMAHIYHFKMLEDLANHHLAGDPLYRQLQRKYLPVWHRYHDLKMANNSDADVLKQAEKFVECSGLPANTLRNVELDLKADRDACRERMSWCRYLYLEPARRWLKSSMEFYAKKRDRYGYCEKFDYRTQIGSKDHLTVLSAFKGTYCEGCIAREPMNQTRLSE